MKDFLSEDEAKEQKNKLTEEMSLTLNNETREYSSYKINFIDLDPKKQNIDYITSLTKNLISKREDEGLLFISHRGDEIKGKPQLIFETKQSIKLISRLKRQKTDNDGNWSVIKTLRFFYENFDKRMDGTVEQTLFFNFYMYKVIFKDEEYTVLSKDKLPNEVSLFRGMNINVDDFSELNKNLKLKRLSNIFILEVFEPTVKILNKEDLIEEVKQSGLSYEDFQELVFTHPDGNVYNYTPEFNLLRIAQLLSSKWDGYPLHILKIGVPGTGKTIEQETLDFKFGENQGILEAGSSTLKALEPSFKSKPANLGYIANCERFGMIDELFKMIETTINKMHSDHRAINQMLGSLNFLLEHKIRTIGSGNDNSTTVQSTSKLSITSNPLSKKTNLYEHIGLIDESTLSRMLIWVQDEEETEKIYKKEFKTSKYDTINNNPAVKKPKGFNKDILSINMYTAERSKLMALFLTVYDSCQVFVSDIDYEKVKKMWNSHLGLIKEPLKRIWKARGLHHMMLVIDGITKYRCLFKSRDSNFLAIDQDYDDLEKITLRMIKNFDTNFQMGFRGF